MPRVALVGLDGAHLSGMGTLLDVFEMINRYTTQQYASREVVAAPVAVRVLSPDGHRIRLSSGRTFEVDDSLAGNEIFDLVYLAPFELGDPPDLNKRLTTTGPVAAWLRRQHEGGAIIAASGAAVILPAQAGLLDDREATAPWWLEREFRRRFPDVRLDIARVISEADRVFCSGSMKGEGALALRLVERLLSPNALNWVAKITLIDPRPDGPEPWTVFSPRVIRQDGVVGRAQHWLQRRFTEKPRIRDLAEALAVSERTLTRRFERSLGMTPLEYLQTLRIEAAKQMLLRSNRRIDRIGYLVGYSDPGFFKKVFKAKTGLSPSLFRRQGAKGEPVVDGEPEAVGTGKAPGI